MRCGRVPPYNTCKCKPYLPPIAPPPVRLLWHSALLLALYDYPLLNDLRDRAGQTPLVVELQNQGSTPLLSRTCDLAQARRRLPAVEFDPSRSLRDLKFPLSAYSAEGCHPLTREAIDLKDPSSELPLEVRLRFWCRLACWIDPLFGG